MYCMQKCTQVTSRAKSRPITWMHSLASLRRLKPINVDPLVYMLREELSKILTKFACFHSGKLIVQDAPHAGPIIATDDETSNSIIYLYLYYCLIRRTRDYLDSSRFIKIYLIQGIDICEGIVYFVL